MQRSSEEQRAAQKVTLIGAIVNLALGLLKVVTGSLAHSTSLVADGIHSLSDLITDLLVMLILKISGKGPDRNHPWGHAQFEAVGTVLLGSILIAVAGAMAYDSVLHLLADTPQPLPTWPALLIAIISILSKEWIYRYTLKVGEALQSKLLIANAWHSRTDALSSIIVVIGVSGAMLGFHWLDAVAAIAVAILVARIGWQLGWNSLQQLVDTALPEDTLNRYRAAVLQIEGVIAVHSFKTRTMGSQRYLELHIQVPSDISASEGHLIGDRACEALRELDQIGHIIYHIDTFDDELTETLPINQALPLRQEIEALVERHLMAYQPQLSPPRINLYYTRIRVDLELLFRAQDLNTLLQDDSLKTLAEQIKTMLQQQLSQPHALGTVYIAGGESV